MDDPSLSEVLTGWYAGAARDLPWRRPGTTPYAVLVSEVMLQQTPVARVVPAYEAWLQRWPTASALAADEPGEAVRQWGRLGYPRRALRLHAAACAVLERHGGELPASVPELLALPGVGDYTARAVAAFAFRQRAAVVDTNVRRVVARAVEGVADAAVTRRDLALVEALLPAEPEAAAVASIALMELGALVCTARAPRCPACPVRDRCAWPRAGAARAGRPGQAAAGLRRHRPAGPRPAARRAARRRRAGRGRPAGAGVGRAGAAGPRARRAGRRRAGRPAARRPLRPA